MRKADSEKISAGGGKLAQAVRLGVCDYLVKPIVMQEFVQTVRKLHALCEQERRRTPETVGSLETVLSGVLHSGMPLDEETTAFLERAYGLGPNDNILELLFYLGDGFPDGRGRARGRIEELLKGQDLGGFCIIDVEYDKSVLALVYGYSSRQAFEAWYQYQIRLWRREMPEDNLGFGITEVSCAGDLREGYRQLEEHMDWSLSLGDGTLISCPEITRLQTEVCVYPIELENQMKISICAGDEAVTIWYYWETEGHQVALDKVITGTAAPADAAAEAQTKRRISVCPSGAAVYAGLCRLSGH